MKLIPIGDGDGDDDGHRYTSYPLPRAPLLLLLLLKPASIQYPKRESDGGSRVLKLSTVV